MRRSAYLVLAFCVAAAFAGFGAFTRSVTAPPIEGALHGATYAPWARDQDPIDPPRPSLLAEFVRTQFGHPPTPYRPEQARPEQIERDMAALAGKIANVRTYSTLDGNDALPAIAARHGLKVVLGAQIYFGGKVVPQYGREGREVNEQELGALIRLANQNPNVERVLVGNEAILRRMKSDKPEEEVSPERLVEHIRRVKRNVKVPVSTSEPVWIWLQHPQLAQAVDFLAVHVLPYWDPSPADGLAIMKAQIEELRARYPNKNIVVTEIGWPSRGASRTVYGRLAENGPVVSAVKRASPADQAAFVREAAAWLKSQKIEHFVIEAIDQPWKRKDLEGLAGGYWGLLDADRVAKWDWTGPIRAFEDWWKLALGALALALPPVWLFLRRWPDIRLPGQLAFGGLAVGAASGTVYAFYVGFSLYMDAIDVAGWTLLTVFLVLSLGMMLVQAHEMAETIWMRRWKREARSAAQARVSGAAPASGRWPKVSIHLAICNEPPAMVAETLDSLAALDYPDFEVLVIDNNTRDPAVWRPVEEHCKALGPRFRFFHFDVMKGFKAGALNHTLSQTAPDADIVAVIDSDYVVRKDWLRTLAPYFDDPKIGYVQAPQDHRDWKGDRFKEMLNWEYAGFFDIGMALRNEYDAILQHGTMTMIRRRLMDELDGWATWCICEDTELGLRMMQKGYGAMYTRERFGHGLTPDHFAGYKKQRFRWAYGAMQILKGHARHFLPGDRTMTFWQKYHFVAGWLPWFADALNLVFTLTGLVWVLGVLLPPLVGVKPVGLPPQEFVIPTLALFAFKLVHSFALYAARVDCTFRQSLGAALAGLSLTYTVGRAVLYGLFTSRLPFMRTPKMDERPSLAMAMQMARGEAALTLALWIAAVAVWRVNGQIDPEARVWAALLVVQSLPFAAAVAVSVVNAWEQVRRLRDMLRGAMAAPAEADGAPETQSASAMPTSR